MFQAWMALPIGLQLLTVMLTAYVVLAVVLGPRRAWAMWKRLGLIIGDAIARAAMTVFYFTCMPLFALITRATRDVLFLRPGAGTLWRPPDSEQISVDEAQRQS